MIDLLKSDSNASNGQLLDKISKLEQENKELQAKVA